MSLGSGIWPVLLREALTMLRPLVKLNGEQAKLWDDFVQLVGDLFGGS